MQVDLLKVSVVLPQVCFALQRSRVQDGRRRQQHKRHEEERQRERHRRGTAQSHRTIHQRRHGLPSQCSQGG